MSALILCAGSARRFFPAGEDGQEAQPKCLLPLTENETILERLLRQLRARGHAVTLGTGCGHEQVAQAAMRAMHPTDDGSANGTNGANGTDGGAHSDGAPGGSTRGGSAPPVHCIYNPDYKTTNSIVTLWQARDFITDATLIINGDVVVDDNVFGLFDEEPSPQLLVKRLSQFDDDTYRVVFDDDGHVVRMGKEIDAAPSPSCAAFVGISRVGCADSFLREIRALLDGGDNQTWPTTAYRRMMSATPAVAVRVCDIGDSLFYDIDTPAEHEAARRALAGARRTGS